MPDEKNRLLDIAHNKLEKSLLAFIILVTFWLGFNSYSFVLISQAVLASSFLIKQFLDSTNQTNPRFNKSFWSLFWIIVSSFLIAIFGILRLLNLQTQIPNPVAGAVIFVALFSLVAQIILIVGVIKKPLKIQFFRDNVSWILVLLSGITVQISNFYTADTILAIAIMIFLLYQNLQSSYKKIDKKQTIDNFDTQDEIEFDLQEDVVTELLKIKKLEQLDNFNVLKINSQFLVAGNLVVANNSSQEDIFEIKQTAKKILVQSGFENSVLEIVYLAEHKK